MAAEEAVALKEAETTEITMIPRGNVDQRPSGLRPRQLFDQIEHAKEDRSKRSAILEPISGKRKYVKDTHTRVRTAARQKVLSSYIRLHLDKMTRLQAQWEAESKKVIEKAR